MDGCRRDRRRHARRRAVPLANRPRGQAGGVIRLSSENDERRRDKPSSLGFGLGLRPVYYQEILEKPRVRWFEVISENYMTPSGRPLVILKRIRADYGSVANFSWRLTGI